MIPGSRLILALALVGAQLAAQGAPWIKGHYTKQEVMVPMRDGTRLFTAIYTPTGGFGAHRPWPILLERTPYSVEPYGKDAFRDTLGPSALFGKEGFIFVYQDVRGRMMSEGTFVDMTPSLDGAPGVDESTDTYDTVAWLLKSVPDNNGKVGQWGISYPAFYTAAGMIGAHPAMKAVSPQAPIVDWFTGDDFHRNGALWLPHLFNFIANFGRPRTGPTTQWPTPFQHGTSDGYGFFLAMGPLAQANARYFHGGIPFWNDVMAHGTYDAYWQVRNLRPHLKDIRPAVLTVGGWFDAENLYGALQVHKTLDAQSPATDHRLVMGPWVHGGWSRTAGDRLGDVQFQSATSEFYQTRIEFPFFMHHLKAAPDPDLPGAYVFRTGANVWQRFETWPPKAAHTADLWFQAKGSLGFQRDPEDGEAAWVSDPAHPVPFYNGINIGMAQEYMDADQRFAERRPDVAVFATGPLDHDLTLAGPIQADLWVSTTGTDADWVVKVIDVYPDDFRYGPEPLPVHRRPAPNLMGGYEQLVRGEAMRGKFRHSFSAPEPFVPGQPTEVAFTLNDVCHTFVKGHRIMVQIQSSWFPLMDRNPQVFTDIYQAKEEAFSEAEQRLLFGPRFPSRLGLPVLP